MKASETQRIVCSLCIRELQCTKLSKGIWAQIQWILWEGPKPREQLTATICSQQCNYSMKRQRFYCLISFAQKRGHSYECKTAKLHDWPKMGRQLLVQRTTQYFSLYQDCHHIPAAFCLQHRDQRIRLILPYNWEHYWIQQQLEVTSMHAGNRCWQIMTSRPRGTANQQTRRTRKIQRKAFLFGCSPSQVFWRTWRDACVSTFFWQRELRFERWCFKSGHTKTEEQCSCSLPQKPKEMYSASRKVWWLDNSRAQSPQWRKWIPEQSPIRCRGTSSRHSVESVSNQNFTEDGEEFTKVHRNRRRSQKGIHADDLLEFGKHCEELSWNHRTTTLHRSETSGIAQRAVSRGKEETSAVLLQSGSGDKWWSDSVKCCCYLRDVQNLLADGKSQNERRFGYLSRTCFVRGVNLGRTYSDCIKNISEKTECERSPDNTTKDGEFVFLVADGSAKLPGRDYEFQEPTLRRESTVKRDNFSGESHGDREEFRPEEQEDDAEDRE